MKKILAAAMAIFTAAIMAGCEKNTADEQLIEDIDIASGTEITEIFDDMEEIFLDEEEASSETEITVEEITEDTVPETEAIDYASTDFPVGRWIENRAYIYDFDENGNISINTGHYDIKGTYTYEDNVLTLSFNNKYGETMDYCFDITVDESGYAMDYQPVINDWWQVYPYAYQPAGMALGFIEEMLWENEPFYLKKGEEPRPAQPNEIKGAWSNGKTLFIFDEDRYIQNHYSYLYDYKYDSAPENGRLEFQNYYGENECYILWLYDNKLYINGEYFLDPYMLERYDPASVTAADLNGQYIFDNDENYMVTLEDGKFSEQYHEDEITGEFALDSGKIIFTASDSETVEFAYYTTEDYIYLINDEGLHSMFKTGQE